MPHSVKTNSYLRTTSIESNTTSENVISFESEAHITPIYNERDSFARKCVCVGGGGGGFETTSQ